MMIPAKNNHITLNVYDIETYEKDIASYGVEKTWARILKACEKDYDPEALFSIPHFGELYETGLAAVNKTGEKAAGKYFTPADVSFVMAKWLSPLAGKNVCDVCCGTGNLILAYLESLGQKDAIRLLKAGRLYLYDNDPVALDICVRTIGLLYGKEATQKIHTVCRDFLDRDVHLPADAKVICNPPYFKLTDIRPSYEETETMRESREFYSVIMEKILRESTSSVIITPYSFISGKKFYALRKQMNDHTGFIVSFDNVPANIFRGRKHGIFNSNTTISVRAAITVTTDAEGGGYIVSPLIRFKTEERERLLQNDVLERTLPASRQKVDDLHPAYHKCAKELEVFYERWASSSKKSIGEVSSDKGKYALCVPDSCRYFTVASRKTLHREGKYYLFFRTREEFDLAYALLNSSLNYWHWRMFDGGINYSHALLNSLPSDFTVFSDHAKKELTDIAHRMQAEEEKFLVYKKNAGSDQENIKFPEDYRRQINRIICREIEADFDYRLLDALHSNRFFEKAS